MVAGAALTAALTIGALPGIAGSAGPSPASVIDPVTFQSVQVPAFAATQSRIGPPDQRFRAAAGIHSATVLEEPANEPVRVVNGRPNVDVPPPRGGSAQKKPRFTLTGEASFYDNGTTAMRLPRGTTVIICGAGGCVERVISDYGPATWAGGGGRIADLYRPDFFAICGCGWWSGVTRVTVSVY